MLDIKPGTLTGDIRDFLLTHMRANETPWSKLSEDQQSDKIHACGAAAVELVAGVVETVQAHDFPKVAVNVGKFAGKDGELKIELVCLSTDKNLLAINGARTGVFIVADPAVFFGEREPAVAEPNQHALALGAEQRLGDGEGFDDPSNEPDGLDHPQGDSEFEEPEGGVDATHLPGAAKRKGRAPAVVA